MGKYGEVAELAVSLMGQDNSLTPREAWREAAARVFPDSRTARAKGCPKDSFLTLCETGSMEHVEAGAYTRSIRNKRYITRALAALRTEPRLADDPKRLWLIATDGAAVTPNHQIDVLTALWRRGLIRK
jgi:hypothetical protein